MNQQIYYYSILICRLKWYYFKRKFRNTETELEQYLVEVLLHKIMLSLYFVELKIR